MKTKRWAALMVLIGVMALFSGLAEAANGTLKVTFKYKDPATGVEQNLNYGFIYLHSAANGAPMEKYFSKADVIVGPSNYGNGVITRQVPAGTYYIRITQRKVVAGATRPYGPPEAGDYTWMQTTPITITAYSTLDLGTKYAYPFAATPITITGTVKQANGTPRSGYYVRAQTEPCIVNTGCYSDGSDFVCEEYTNQCGPDPYLAASPTDASGKFTLSLREPGIYYLYASSSWNTAAGCGGYCAPLIVGRAGPVLTVNVGDMVTADIIY